LAASSVEAGFVEASVICRTPASLQAAEAGIDDDEQ
jgi:hypothetical protein